MTTKDKNEKLGVYVSVPFCRAKCSFCNFASGVSGAETVERYVAALCAEIGAASERAERMGAVLPRVVDTVYFGGGTPSLLERIFAALLDSFAVEEDAEITMEAAPEQIEDEVLEEAMRLGVNRVSLGVQSFVDRESAAVGRSHTGESCMREVRRLRTRGLLDVGVDLIAGLPYQTAESWARSLEAVAELVAEGALTHASVYMLEIDEESRLGREVLGGGARLHAPAVASDELAAELYEMACERMARCGLKQYEISNFALEGFASRHNRKYWERRPYLGVGLDAHSMLVSDDGAVRFANVDAMEGYLGAGVAGLSTAAHERASGRDDTSVVRVGEREAFEERVFLGLRMVEGVATVEMAECEEAALELRDEGLMTLEDGRWKLTVRGRLVSNEVFGRLLEGVAA
jgi:oxygen-independent coproporphyrinogen-3 oxidase